MIKLLPIRQVKKFYISETITCFILILQTLKVARAGIAVEIMEASDYTILVVDDEEGIRDYVSQSLIIKGFSVLLANDGEEALRVLRANEVHLMISDVRMPGMSGLELAEIVGREWPQMRIIIISGYAGGMDGLKESWHFLAKPFLPSVLIAKVKSVLDPPFADRAVA